MFKFVSVKLHRASCTDADPIQINILIKYAIPPFKKPLLITVFVLLFLGLAMFQQREMKYFPVIRIFLLFPVLTLLMLSCVTLTHGVTTSG